LTSTVIAGALPSALHGRQFGADESRWRSLLVVDP
jgi:hypothetical protein